MQPLKCSRDLCVAIALLLVCHTALAMPGVRVKRQDNTLTLELDNTDADLNPINAEDVSIDDLERNKRKLPDATFEAKNAVLGFVFGLENDVPKPESNYRNRVRRATNKSKTGDDTPEFDRTNVSLDFPDQLFNKSFKTLTNVSKVVSKLMVNSARRYARFMLFLKPLFGDALIVKGYEEPTTTTKKPVRRATGNEV